jgi:hypothetical protein
VKVGVARGAKVICSGVLVLGALLRPSAASAAELTWTAPEACPSAEHARRALEEAIHQPLADAEPLRFEVIVELEADGTARASVTVRDNSASAAPKQRVIVAKDCSEAADAAVVAMALALASGEASADDSGSGTGHGSGEPTAAGEDAQTAELSTVKRPPQSGRSSGTSTRRPSAASALRASTEAGFVLDFGSLPGTAPGAEVGVSLGWRQIGARLTGVVLPRSSTKVRGEAGATFTLLAAAFALCGRTADGVYVAETCAGGELGRLSGSGYGVTDPGDASSRWVAPRADVTLRLRMGASWAGFLRGGGAVPLVRNRFNMNNVGPVHQAEPAVWRLGIGLWFEL